MKRVHCTDCGFEDSFTPSEFGLGVYQVDNHCPQCETGEMVYEDGQSTTELILLHFDVE